MENKVVSLEPYLEEPTLDDDDEPEEHGTSKFERPVKGRMPLLPKRPGLPADTEACMQPTPAQLAEKRKREAKERREAAREWANTPPDLKRYYKRVKRVIALRMKHYHE